MAAPTTLVDKNEVPVTVTAGALAVTGSVTTTPSTSTAPVVPAAATATTGDLIAVQCATTKPTFTNGQQGAVTCDTRGNLPFALFNPDGTLGLPVRAITPSGTVTPTSAAPMDSFTQVFNPAANAWVGTRGDTNAISVLPGLSSTFWSYAAATGGITNTTTAVTVKAAVASIRNYVSAIQIDWDTLGAATEIAIRDGAGGTVLWRGKLQTTSGQRAVTLPVPLRGTANTLLEVVTLTASITGSVFVNLQGFTGA
jgi:hypothetical protein